MFTPLGAEIVMSPYTKEEFIKCYVTDNMTIYEMAATFHVSYRRIQKDMQVFGVQARKACPRRNHGTYIKNLNEVLSDPNWADTVTGLWPSKRMSIRQRFEEHIEMLTESGCWIWMGAINEHGYGKFGIGYHDLKAHRAAWMIYMGAIPAGMNVLHHCDTPPCCNPYHLYLGSQKENSYDCLNRNRHKTPFVDFFGMNHPNAKLNDDLVRKILSDNREQRVIAKEYGVSQHTIWSIKKRLSWSHVDFGNTEALRGSQ